MVRAPTGARVEALHPTSHFVARAVGTAFVSPAPSAWSWRNQKLTRSPLPTALMLRSCFFEINEKHKPEAH